MTHYLLSVRKTFSQENPEAFLNFFAITQNKKTSPACFNILLWKELRRKDLVLFGFSKDKLVGTLSLLFNMGFRIKTACKNSWKIALSKVLLTSRCKHCRNYTLWFHWCTTEVGPDPDTGVDSGRILRFSFWPGSGVKHLWKTGPGSGITFPFRQ